MGDPQCYYTGQAFVTSLCHGCLGLPNTRVSNFDCTWLIFAIFELKTTRTRLDVI